MHLDLSQKAKGIIRLLPHNDAYQPIITAEQRTILWGVVTYCIHRSSRAR